MSMDSNFFGKSFRHSQAGSSLIISLLLMVALVLVGFGAATSSLFQERMAGNARDRSAAFNAAEAGLRDAEQYMREKSLPQFVSVMGSPFSTPGHYELGALDLGVVAGTDISANSSPMDLSSEEIWASKKAIASIKTLGITYGAITSRPALPGVPEQPKYLLEQMPPEQGRMVTYRITSVGFGPNDSIVVLQSFYTPPQFTVTS